MWLARFPFAAGLLLSFLITQPTQATEAGLSKVKHRHHQHSRHKVHHRLRKPASKEPEQNSVSLDAGLPAEFADAMKVAGVKGSDAEMKAPDSENTHEDGKEPARVQPKASTKKATNDVDAGLPAEFADAMKTAGVKGSDAEAKTLDSENTHEDEKEPALVQQRASTKKVADDADQDEDAAVQAKLAEADQQASEKAETNEGEGKDADGNHQGSEKAAKTSQNQPSREECQASAGEAEGCDGTADGGVVQVSKKGGGDADDGEHAIVVTKKHRKDTDDEDGDDGPPLPKKHRRHAEKERSSGSDSDFMSKLKTMDPEQDPMELEAQREGITWDDDDKRLAPPVESSSEDDGDDGDVEGDAVLVAKPARTQRVSHRHGDQPGDDDDDTDAEPVHAALVAKPARTQRASHQDGDEPADDDDDDTDAAPMPNSVAKLAAKDGDDAAPQEVKNVGRASRARNQPDLYHRDDNAQEDTEDVDAEEAHEALKHGKGISTDDLQQMQQMTGLE